ncbi:hypothetical protein ACFVWY_12290 [Streptomyces sp. NPDC058195]|uniref:hypothetical protein n=1 Tax=Streptomyces sp. NPDC058195 TaxID=3346375 RepID=UPI0036E45222
MAAELLMALASGTAGAAGQSLWERLRALVRRQAAADAVGEGELAAFAEDTADGARARALAGALALRADQDPAFAQALALWRQEAERVHGGGDTRQEISGGTQHNVVFTRDVHGPINLN